MPIGGAYLVGVSRADTAGRTGRYVDDLAKVVPSVLCQKLSAGQLVWWRVDRWTFAKYRTKLLPDVGSLLNSCGVLGLFPRTTAVG